MTRQESQWRQIFFIEPDTMMVWAMLGAVMLVNAVLARLLFADQGANAAISAALAMVFLVPPLLRIVYDDFKEKRVHMNELVLIAVAAGAARGDYLTAGLIAFFMLIGLIIETRSAPGARESLEALSRLTPGKAHRIGEDGTETDVEPAALVPGDRIRVRPGETVPADGTIQSGNSSLQEASITGESLPADKGEDAQVFAGTINLTGVLQVVVASTGADTTLGKVKQLILEAERTRPHFVRMIDHYARHHTPLVLLFAFFVWASTGHEMERVVAVLVAACPIALVLSTPSAAVAALSAGARLGVLIKNVRDIEALSTVSAFVFDKTGTLTTGNLEVMQLAPATNVDSSDLLAAAACAEQHSNHPVAQAICRLARKVNIALPAIDSMHEEPGRGIRSRAEDHEICVGNIAWMADNGAAPEDFADHQSEDNEGMSLLFVLRDGKALGWIALADSLRKDAGKCIRDLENAGLSSLTLVTGDRVGVARRVAAEIGISSFHGECKPADKIEKVQQIKDQGHKTVFVGDGVNDAPALAASDIGIAMGAAGSDLAVDTATIALMNSELNRLPFLVRLARRYKRVMIQNYIIGGLFVFGGMLAGAAGYLTAVPAALLQAASAVAIVMNSARLVRGEDSL